MIKKYIFIEFFKFFLFIFSALILLFWIADFFSGLSLFLNSKTSFSIILEYFLLKTPEGLYYIIPFSVFAASMTLFGILNIKYEIIAFRTLSINKMFIYKSLILIGFLFYIILFFNNEFLIPKTFYQRKIIKNVYLKKKKNYAVLKSDKIWYKKKNYILKINFANFDRGFMSGITIYEFDKNFNIMGRIDAPTSFYRNKKWILYSAEVYTFKEKGTFLYKKYDKYIMPVEIKKEDFVAINSENRNLNFIQLYKIIKNLENSSINLTEYKTDLINRFVYPLTAIFFLILGFLLNIKNPREKSAVASILLSILIGFGFFILHSFFVNLGYINIIPYFIAPFASFFIFGIILFLLDKKVRY